MAEQINTDFEELKNAVESLPRTDGLTLPNPPTFPNEKLLEYGQNFKKAILDPTNENKNLPIDEAGTTYQEWVDATHGIMPKDAPKEALDSVGKHTFEVVEIDGVKVVKAIAPETPATTTPTPETPVFTPAPFTKPVPTVKVEEPKTEVKEPFPNK